MKPDLRALARRKALFQDALRAGFGLVARPGDEWQLLTPRGGVFTFASYPEAKAAMLATYAKEQGAAHHGV